MEMNLYCPINPTTGYGITSTHTAIALDKLGIKISLFNIMKMITISSTSIIY